MTSISAVTIDLNYKAGDYPKGKPWQQTYAPKPKQSLPCGERVSQNDLYTAGDV